MTPRRFVLFSLTVLVCHSAGAAANAAPAGMVTAPPPAPAARAETNEDARARELFLARRYADALAIYVKLRAETGHPTYLRNLGRCHQMLRQAEPAIAQFRAYLAEARDLPAAERAEIEGYIVEMERLRAAAPPRSAAGAPAAVAPPPAAVTSSPPASSPPAPAPPASSPPAPAPPASSPPASSPPAPARSSAPSWAPSPIASSESSLSAGRVTAAGEVGGEERAPRRWLVWTGIGAAAVAAIVTTALIVSSGGDKRLPCPADTVCSP